MIFVEGKYYVCVRNYILSEKETEQDKSNKFIDTLRKTSRLNLRSDYEFRSRYENYYAAMIEDPVIVPAFTVGMVYKCPTSGMLFDDHHNTIVINDDNENTFVYLDFKIDNPTRNFMFRTHNAGFYIQIIPEQVVLTTQEERDNIMIMNINKCPIRFTVYGNCNYGVSYTTAIYVDEKSVRYAVYDVWKKLRTNSILCRKLKDCTIKKTIYMPSYDIEFRAI